MPSKVQFIAYQIKTAAEGDMSRVDYPGLADQKRDIEARCKILMDAIEAANASTKIDRTAKKIFAAPEFFFRGGQGGVYDVENIPYVSEMLDKHLSAAKYAKWIFVLGTTLGAMPANNGKTEILNIALIRRGGKAVTGATGGGQNGLAAASSETRLVYKEYISPVDFLGPVYNKSEAFQSGKDVRAPALANVRGAEAILAPTSGARATGKIAHADKANLQGRGGVAEESRTGLGGGSRFTMDGLDFIVEICGDHDKSRAKLLKEVDIHLLTSCGMMPGYCTLKLNGLMLHVDGSAIDDTLASVGQKTTASKEVADLEKPASIEKLDMTLSIRWHNWLGPAKNLFQAGRGRVIIFPSRSVG